MQVAKITAVFSDVGDPVVVFEGDINPIHINSLLLRIRMGYANYTQEQRLKELVEQKDRMRKADVLKAQMIEEARLAKNAVDKAEIESAKAAAEVIKQAEALAQAGIESGTPEKVVK